MPTESAAAVSSPSPPPHNDGALDVFMSRIFGRSWRTGLTGLAAFACGLVPLVPAIPPIVQDICRVALPMLTGTGLIMAKDSRVSGPNR